MMGKSKKPDLGNTVLGICLRACRHPWSKEFTRTILNELRRACAGKEGLDWPVRSLLKEIACSMEPALAKEAEKGWPTDSTGWEHSADAVNEMLALLQFRHQMLEELKK